MCNRFNFLQNGDLHQFPVPTKQLYNRHIGGNGGTCYLTWSLSYSFCVQCSQTSKLLTFGEILDQIFCFCLWSPFWSSCSFSVLYFISLYPTLLASLDCPFSSLPLSVFSKVFFIFHCAWSTITLPPRKKTDVTSVNFSVVLVISTHQCENNYPMLFVSLDCLFSTLLFRFALTFILYSVLPVLK